MVLLPWWISRWTMHPPFFGLIAIRIVGWLLMTQALLPYSIPSRALPGKGLGTPAPVLPTKHLVVSGLYRYVREIRCYSSACWR